MYASNEHQQLSRRSLVGQAIGINHMARRYFRAEVAARIAAAAKDAYEAAHGAVGKVPLIKIVEYFIYAAGLVCVYGIDILLFGTSAQYVASLLGGEGSLWASAAKYAVPAFFLGLEVLISIKIERARQEERFEFGSTWARRAWIALGVLVALVMPLAARATAESVGVVAENQVPVLMVAVLGIVSFAAHILVLFGGRVALEAKTYLAYTAGRQFHKTRTKIKERKAAMTLAEVNAAFISYVHAWRAHNGRHDPEPSGPFDKDVVEFLRRQFPHVASGRREASFPTLVEDEEAP
jgi:hypothetical protein